VFNYLLALQDVLLFQSSSRYFQYRGLRLQLTSIHLTLGSSSRRDKGQRPIGAYVTSLLHA
jgi:hypothetical protein